MKLSKKEELMFSHGLTDRETEQLIYEKRIGRIIFGGIAVICSLVILFVANS